MEVVPSNYWIMLSIDSVFDKLGTVWQGQDCPFDDLNVGQVVLSNYANGSGLVTVPDKAKHLGYSGSCKFTFNGEGRGKLSLIMSTTKEIVSQLDKNACIQIDIDLTDVEVEDFVKSFFSTDKKGLLIEAVQQYKIKKLDSGRFEKKFPKYVRKEFSTNFSGSLFGHSLAPGTVGTVGSLTFQNVLIVLKVTLSAPVSDAEIAKIWMKNQQIAGEKLLTEGLVTDFTIEAANGKKFHCHKSYLVGKSVIFAGMMNSKMTEANSHTLKMEDMSPDAVEGFLTYLYTGNLKKVMSNMSVIFEMLQAAHKYQIQDLEIVCNKVIQSAESKLFDAGTAFELFEFCGNVAELQSLQKKAVKLLKDNGKKYGDNGELQTLINFIASSGQKQMAFAKWMSDSLQL